MKSTLAAGLSALTIATGYAMSADDVRHARLSLPGKHDAGRTIILEADVACSADQSYTMWSTESGVRLFFAPAAHIGTVGGPYTIIFFPSEDPEGVSHGTAGAHVLAAERGRFFAFEWVVFAGDKLKGDNAPPYAPETLRRPTPLPTWVEIEFTPNKAGTHVSFAHFGFGDGELWAQSRAWFTRAWGGVLTQMQNECAH